MTDRGQSIAAGPTGSPPPGLSTRLPRCRCARARTRGPRRRPRTNHGPASTCWPVNRRCCTA